MTTITPPPVLAELRAQLARTSPWGRVTLRAMPAAELDGYVKRLEQAVRECECCSGENGLEARG